MCEKGVKNMINLVFRLTSSCNKMNCSDLDFETKSHMYPYADHKFVTTLAHLLSAKIIGTHNDVGSQLVRGFTAFSDS